MLYEATEGFMAELADHPVRVHAGHTRVRAGHALLEMHPEKFRPCKDKQHRPGTKLVASSRFGVMEVADIYLKAASTNGEAARYLTHDGSLVTSHDVMPGDPYGADEALPLHFPQMFEPAE